MAIKLAAAEVDLIEELQLRRWARENYVPPTGRDATWHPVVHDEMGRKDLDAAPEAASAALAS